MPTDLEEIRRAYPDCAEAVEDCERTILPQTWAILRRHDVPVEEAIEFIRESLEEWERGTGGRKTFEQMDTPGFRRYVAAKLGMV